MFQYVLKYPLLIKQNSEHNQYFVGGGAVSNHNSKHISSLNIINHSISWKLSFLSVLTGN